MLARNRIRRGICAKTALIDAHTHIGINPANFYEGNFPYATCADDMIVRMDMTKVDFALCFPFGHTAYFSLPSYRRGKLRHNPKGDCPFPYKVENERLCREIYEAFPQYAGRLLPFAFFDPARRPREQAAFVEALAKRYPVFGLKTATSYLRSPITNLLGEGQCILDLAARHNIPLTIHSAVIPGDPWGNVFDILQVVRERSDVRFAIAHTCRFDRRALDQAAELENCFVDFSAFHIHCLLARQNHPTVAPRRYRFPADYRNHAAAMQKIVETYPQSMLWGSDTPGHYFMSRFINESGEEIRTRLSCDPYTETQELRKLPKALQNRIGYTNTIRFLFGERSKRI